MRSFHSSSVVRSIVVGCFAALGGGCIFFVSAEAGGQHCRFAAEDSTCGSCVKLRCQDVVDRACVSGRDGVLANLDGCTTTRDARCAALLGDMSSAEARDLATCLGTECSGSCAPTPSPPITRCEPEPLGDGRACSCSLASPPTSFVCAEAVEARTVCCAPAGWPGPGLSCSCLPLDCASNSDGCSCFLSTYAAKSEVCTGRVCCASATSCKCGTGVCVAAAGEHQVDQCTIAELGCADGQTRVASCTLTKDQ